MPRLSSTKVLMIEDDFEISTLIKTALEHNKYYHVEIATDPFQAMNLMSEHFYNFVILDWKLPFLNGNETIETADRSLNLDPSLPEDWDRSKVPVIILSSSEEADCRLKESSHFKYSGYVSKQQPAQQILNQLDHLFLNQNSLSSLSA